MKSLFSGDLDLSWLKEYCYNFATFYRPNVGAESLYQDVLNCCMLLMNCQESDIAMPSSAKELLESIIMYGKDVFPDF